MNKQSTRAILVSLIMILSSLAGCIGDEDLETVQEVTDLINDGNNTTIIGNLGTVMVSTYHIGELVKGIAGEHVEMEYMSLDNIPVHDYEPSASDLIRLQNADVFFYHGLGLEPWVDETLDSLGSDAPTSIQVHTMPTGEETLDYESMLISDLCKTLTAGPFETVELVDHEEHADDVEIHSEFVAHNIEFPHDEHGDDHDDHADEEGDDHDDHGDEGALDYDPHSWLSPLAFKAQVTVVMDALTTAFPAGEEVFKTNAELYAAQLTALDVAFDAAFGEGGMCMAGGYEKTVAANHNAYSYIGVEYGIQFMTVHGLDPEGEPSPEDVAKVVDFIKEEGITVLFVEEYTDPVSYTHLTLPTKA